VPSQRALYLSRLDTEAAHLHLLVEPADELNAAVGEVAGLVAGSVKQRARFFAERVWDKPLRCEHGAIQVPARQSRAADVKLARDADGDGAQSPVEQIDL
jgi:hypothetical protein